MSRRIVAAILLVLLPTLACHSWQPLEGPLEAPVPRTLRLELRSGEAVDLHDAVLYGDTIAGRPAGTQDLALIPVSEVTAAREGRLDRGRTALAVAGAAAGAFGVLAAIALSNLEISIFR